MPWLHMCTHLYTPEHLHSFCNKDIAGQKQDKKECSWNVKDKQTKQQQKNNNKKRQTKQLQRCKQNFMVSYETRHF